MLRKLLYQQHQILILTQQLFERIEVKDEWLDNNDLVRLLKVSDKTLYRWRKQGLLVPYRIGGKCYYSKKSLEEMMNVSKQLNH